MIRIPALLFLALGCAAAPQRDAAWEQHAGALSGKWSIRFSYATGQSTTGTMQLTPNRTIDHAYSRIGIPTNYGTYAVAFHDLGGPPSGRRVPAVAAGFVGDSVYILFETDREPFAMQMRGTLRGDSVRGTWAASQSRGTIASGTFIMSRQ